MDLLESDSQGSARNGQGETEYQRTATVGVNHVETPIRRALEELVCGDHEALRHFKDGMVKCAPAVPVPDCTERTNLRRWGTGDFFFSYRAQVCVTETHTAETTTATEAEVGGMTLDGGVGDPSGN